MANDFEDRYRKMSDDELVELAASGDQMMPDARAALDAELSSRNLRDQLEAQQKAIRERATRPTLAGADDGEALTEGFGALQFDPEFMDPNRLPVVSSQEGRDQVVIARFRDLVPAQLAQGALQSAGIEAELLDENMVRVDWFVSNAIGGIRLVVDREDAAAAVEILQAPPPDIIDVGEQEP